MTKLWQFNRVTGYWAFVRSCDDDTASQWDEVYQQDEYQDKPVFPNSCYKLSKIKPNARGQHV